MCPIFTQFFERILFIVEAGNPHSTNLMPFEHNFLGAIPQCCGKPPTLIFRRNTVNLWRGHIFTVRRDISSITRRRVMFTSTPRAAIALCPERGVRTITSMRRLGSVRHAPRVAPDLTAGTLHTQQSLRRFGATTPVDGKKHLQRVFLSRPSARCPLALICRPTPQCLRPYRQSNLKVRFPSDGLRV